MSEIGVDTAFVGAPWVALDHINMTQDWPKQIFTIDLKILCYL